jgi:hypothetical protein
MHDIAGLAGLHGLSVKEEPRKHSKLFFYLLRNAIVVCHYPSAHAASTSTLRHHTFQCVPVLVAAKNLYGGAKAGRLNA